ncbi:MAG TPA: anhydro-N-acetylmuramic acid kinase [Verrucomicrobiota bacterium]|nr:anhydro-N-acetylmuramic acid kinase [Verrucomicrobiota bacterium]HNT16074.1 anhydro-N-acetylmuramic acid kinase [Verrucomicrobiota bacterium]
MKSTKSTTPRGGLYVGLMSGTSADGIDAVVVKIRDLALRPSVQLVTHVYRRFPAPFRNRLLRACLHGDVATICELNFELGEAFARAAAAVIRRAGVSPQHIQAIGSHGQTLHHLPRAKFPSTLQIGEACVIAERTGITTVADFRVRDMAAGGQGAPLVPFADWVLFSHPTRPRIIQNIGGIGNLTFLPPAARREDVVAFDTGPGNMILDAVVSRLSRGRQSYDRNGAWAAQGKISSALLAHCLAHPFLQRRPPKTTGREEFGEQFLTLLWTQARRRRLPPADVVATVTEFTALSIVMACRRFIFPRIAAQTLARLEVVVGGGGARNRTLLRRLQAHLGVGTVLCHEAFGMDSSAKEPLAFALLAHETLRQRPANLPSATGARHPVVLGKIVPGGAPHGGGDQC